MKAGNLLFILALVVSIQGCASLKEDIKCVLGISTRQLEDGRKTALKKQFNYDLAACYAKVKKILTETGSYIYHDEPQKMLAIYFSDADTTAAGIFFSAVDAKNTMVEVTSQSTFVKEVISERVFAMLNDEAISELGKAGLDGKK